jgi:hypothetical protein
MTKIGTVSLDRVAVKERGAQGLKLILQALISALGCFVVMSPGLVQQSARRAYIQTRRWCFSIFEQENV